MPDGSGPGLKSEAEAAERLAHFEARHRPFDICVRGISIWRVIRNPVGLALQNLPLVTRLPPRGELLRATVRSIRDLAFLPKRARYAVKSYVSALRIPRSGGYEDIYFGRLLDEVPGGVRLYSLNAGGFVGRSCGSDAPSVDCTAVLVVGAILARLLPIGDGENQFVRLADLVKLELGLAQFPAARIRRMASSLWWQSRIYEWLLRRLGAGTVFSADTGERALLRACRQLGLRFIELQHGIFTADHPDSLPATALSSADRASLLLPDVLALYGEYWLGRLTGTALGTVGCLRPTGASVIEAFRRKRAASFVPSSSCPRLVVTTQGMDSEALANFLARFLALYQEDCLITVKLHPAYDSAGTPYNTALGSDRRVRILKGSEDPNTYELIAESDLHLSIASACHYDALGIGTPTAVIGLGSHALVQDLVNRGDALFVEDAAALAHLVSLHNWPPVAGTTSDRYYRHGFVENLVPLIA